MSYIVTYKRVERSKGLLFFPFLFALVKLLFPSMSLYQESDPVCERFFFLFLRQSEAVTVTRRFI